MMIGKWRYVLVLVVVAGLLAAIPGSGAGKPEVRAEGQRVEVDAREAKLDVYVTSHEGSLEAPSAARVTMETKTFEWSLVEDNGTVVEGSTLTKTYDRLVDCQTHTFSFKVRSNGNLTSDGKYNFDWKAEWKRNASDPNGTWETVDMGTVYIRVGDTGEVCNRDLSLCSLGLLGVVAAVAAVVGRRR